MEPIEEIIPTNEYQTKITKEFLDSLLPEVRDELLDTITNIEFIKRLISPTRKRARDLPRDKDGKIIVDICNPHILEDMEYFRPTGNYYRKHGVVTHLIPNSNPNSEFGKWIRNEIDRIWNGMIRPSDGEWIPGYMYFYLNYTPIIQTKARKGTRQGDRIVDFPQVWEGVYLVFHYLHQARNGGKYNNFEGGQHAVEIARRGASKSYIMAAILACIFICGENSVANKNCKAIVTAYDREKLTKDGTLNKFIEAIDFNAEHTEFPSLRLKDSLAEMHWIMGYKDLKTGSNKGTGNEVLGVTAKDNVDKARGKRCNFFGYEEFGAFKKFIDVWNVNKPSVQDGNYVFGQAFAIGTGGSEGSDFSGALEIIYNPLGYGVYAIPNVFDKGSTGKQLSVFFFGAYLNRTGCCNSDGVSDVIGALKEILQERHTIKYNTSDSMALTRAKAENPITIQEAIMRRESTIYPVSDLTERLHFIDQNPKILDDIYIGKLVLQKDKVQYVPSSEHKPIRNFPHKDNKLEGCIEIHKMPINNNEGIPYPNRYIAGADVYDDDVSNSLSLGSIFVLDLWTDQIVCEYTGRPKFAEDFYEICRRILLFYNAKCNYENNKKGLFSYFSKTHCLHLLTDSLEFLKDKDMIKGELYGNKVKGTISTAPIKAYYRRCIRDWLLKPYQVTKQEGENVIVENYPQLYNLKSRALIQELCTWNPDNNFDRHDALGMLMLLREDSLRIFGGKNPKDVQMEKKITRLENDDYFNRNYRRHNKQ